MIRTGSGRRIGLILALASLTLASAVFPPLGRDAAAAAGEKSVGQPLDVVLITIDTLRADALGFEGNRDIETPNLDALAREGLVFDRAHASSVVTLVSHTNILTGLYPYQHGVRDNAGFRLPSRFPTLATLLASAGYATGAVVAAFPLDSRYGLNRGFDLYDDRYPPATPSDSVHVQERPGTEVVGLALRWLARARAKRRFLWVHLYEPHAPYRPPAPFAQRYASHPYLGEVAAVDAALEPLLRAIRDEGRGRALVIMTADHGEALGDHGELTHGLFAYEATLRVPLVLWCPGRVEPGRTDRLARHVDILPTVLELLRQPVPAGLPGHSLLSPGQEGDTYFESLSASLNRGWAPLTGVIAGGFKYVDLPIPELYDLKKDPGEKQNLVGERRDVVRKLKRLLPAPGAPQASRSIGSEEARRLLSLGYLSGSGSHLRAYTRADDPKTLVWLDAKIHRVEDLHQHGQKTAAISLSREILRERPTMSDGYDLLAFLLEQEGKSLEAAKILRSAIQKGLASEGMHVRLALILSEADKPAEGLEVLATLRESEDPDTQNTIGILLTDAGHPADAVQVFEKVLRSYPENALTLQDMGITFLKMKQSGEALARFNRALEINEKLPRAWNAKGVAQAELGDAAGAMTSWSRAAQLDPAQYDALFNLGLVAARNGRPEVARDALRRFVATAPPDAYSRDLQEARRMLREMGGA